MSHATAEVIPLHICKHGTCGRRATETVGGVRFCPDCAAVIRRSCATIHAAMEEHEALRRREEMALVYDQFELPLAASGEH